MAWTYANLRGNRVLARVRQDGTFDAHEGKVEVRYRPNDGRAYFASAANLVREAGAELLPDEHCAPADGVPKGAKDAQGAKGAAKVSKKAQAPAAARAGEWVAYADGACSGNPGPAGLGIVLVTPAGKIHEGREYLGTATNNIAELMAILRVLEATPADAPGVLIHTDSQYSIGVLSKGWKAKANQELIATIKAVLKKRPEVRLSYVPGHAGVPLNERADELAREAVKTGKSVEIVVEKPT
jgi:ribonuclease HI